MGVRLRTDDVLDREAAVLKVAVRANMHRFQMIEQCSAPVPRGVLRPVHHVVPVQGADGDEFDVGDVQTRGEVLVGLDDVVEALFAVVHEVHFVDAHHDMPKSQKGGDEAVAVGLFEKSMARIDQDDGKVCRGGTCHHVAGVLDVSRRVRDDEFALGRGEVAVGHIDGDALLALGLESVREEAQVGAVDAFLAGG